MKLRSKLMLIVLSLVTVCSSLYILNIKAETKEDDLFTSNDDYFYILDEEGNPIYFEYDDTIYTDAQVDTYSIVYYDNDGSEEVLAEFDSFEEANQAFELRKSINTFNNDGGELQLKADAEVKSGTNLIARLKGYFTYTEVLTGRTGYMHGASASDGAYIQTNSNGTIRIKVAGVVADVPAANVTLVPFSANEKVSYYYVDSNNRLYHYFTYNQTYLSSVQVGYGQSYLAKDTKYYSYDGHYFYKDYATMLSDYRNNTYKNSVNVSTPYYNYYQYLSFRSKTSLTADQLNQYITDTKGSDTTSKLKNSGQDFITAQNKYGANAGLMFGIGINESAWGTSTYAKDRNNLFGHNAVDSDPDQATRYSSILECINAHAYKYISKGYLDGGDSRYRGPHLGDKQSGMNVKYASDPYWGEKAASHNYKMNNKYQTDDYGSQKIGIINGEHWFYKEASTTSTKIYTSGAVGKGNASNIYDFPVTIIGETTDSSGKKWYKIWSDTVLNDTRTAKDYAGEFKDTRDYVYIQAEVVNVVYEGTGKIEVSPEPEIVYAIGDIDNNGKVDSMDMYYVTQHILEKKLLEGPSFKAADTDNNKKIDSMDMYNIIQIILKNN